tara:strand:- start:28984 stop:30405 length:1422 start_codon:yes stop_codon:yes gene_type:complete
METSLKRDEEEKKDKLNKKIMETFGVFSIIILSCLVIFYGLMPENFNYLYDLPWKKYKCYPDGSNDETMCGNFRIPYFNLQISLYSFVKGILAILFYIGFFEALTAIPEDLQKIIFGEIILGKNKNFITKSFNDFSCYTGAGNNSHFIGSFINIVYVVNIFAIFYYVSIGKTLDNISSSIFWVALIMFYLFLYILTTLYLYQTKATRDAAIGITVIGIAAFLLSFNMTPEEIKSFSPAAEGYLIKRILLILPCLYIFIVNGIKEALNDSTPTSRIILGINTMIITLYIILSRINLFKPKVLLNEPVYLDNERKIAEENENIFEEIDKNKYKKSISFWLNINKVKDRDIDYNIIKVSDKFKFTFNEKYEELKLHVDKYNGTREVLFSYQNILFQKWNNIILNYRNGTVDVFINGALVNSQPGVILKDVYSSVIVGQNGGLNGGICNVKYYDNALTLEKIEKLYNSSKNNNPPTI